jgi:hypothetical protein
VVFGSTELDIVEDCMILTRFEALTTLSWAMSFSGK